MMEIPEMWEWVLDEFNELIDEIRTSDFGFVWSDSIVAIDDPVWESVGGAMGLPYCVRLWFHQVPKAHLASGPGLLGFRPMSLREALSYREARTAGQELVQRFATSLFFPMLVNEFGDVVGMNMSVRCEPCISTTLCFRTRLNPGFLGLGEVRAVLRQMLVLARDPSVVFDADSDLFEVLND